MKAAEPNKTLAISNEVLRGVVGSTALGTAIDGQDDRDEMGVCVEPLDYVCGLRKFEQYVYRDQSEGVRSQAGDLDLTIYSLRKFCRLAAQGNPSVLVLLWLPEYMIKTATGEELIAIREAFISRNSGERFLGYLVSQRKALAGERAKKVQRPELVEKYGYDTKFAMHALRLGLQGIEYLTEGRISLPIREPDLTKVRAVREGRFSYSEALAEIEETESQLRALVDRFERKADYERINGFLVSAHIREAEAAAREDERKVFLQELEALSEKPFDVEVALAGQGQEISTYNAGQVGFASAIFAMKAAIEARGTPEEGGGAT